MAILKPTPLFNCNNFEHTVYLYSKSSNATVIKLEQGERLNAFKSLFIRGESLFTSDIKGGTDCAQIIVKQLNAKLMFCERVAGLLTKYYYSPKIFNYVLIANKRINLQVVLSANGVTIASPLAFDGY